jgi:hypothetical protein
LPPRSHGILCLHVKISDWSAGKFSPAASRGFFSANAHLSGRKLLGRGHTALMSPVKHTAHGFPRVGADHAAAGHTMRGPNAGTGVASG